MKYWIVFFSLILLSQVAESQVTEPAPDSSGLAEIIVRGYESQRRVYETPASVAILGQKEMDRYAPSSLVPALNTIPGVRMEERSPGSYRLSLRGSLLRSPFGVRNIKIYWNDIPFTDAGGNTYFNLVDQSGLQQLEILKGPGGSLYGANTGGVILMQPDEPLPGGTGKTHQGLVQVTGGSYGLLDESAKWKFRSPGFTSSLTQAHLQSDGYRDNTRLRRDVIQWSGAAKTSARNQLSWIMLHANMFYRTPGGLTLAQMQENPRMSRPNAIQQKAAIYNQTLLTGINNRYTLNDHWSNNTSVVYTYTDFKNPFLFNYETRSENNFGLRSKMVYQDKWGQHAVKFTGGVEWLFNKSRINNYGNNKGVQDTVQYRDIIGASQFYPFLQGEWLWGKSFQIQAGLSTNFFNYNYQRLTEADDSRKNKQLNRQVLPRVAALYLINPSLSAYATVSRGFSPPTIAEIRPSEGSIYSNLQAESGWNYEIGLKGKAVKNKLFFDLTAYQFKLTNAIVRRQTDVGEYFVNAGGTDQKGVEILGEYTILHTQRGFLNDLKLWITGTLNYYQFKNYTWDTKDYSGNDLTGVAKQIGGIGADLASNSGLGLNLSYLYTSKLPLTDDNAFYAPSYNLVSGKLYWKKEFNALSLTFFVGVDNALNQLYSLGNDINAAGNRFYNPAPVKNYYGGVSVKL